ncbi:DNA repair protein RecN [Siculibacillus lacustris]|uniref:DNA repair protein RecN n=1 Tax=Siculibacillus lacustris TaxID=1549641 RepID=A0A4V6MZ36_9HYPH|nr:DNA repair protein RecN [Siculibacillus lacustris]TBW38700.1 DNA repair protein RecN [Siculibacillus lacustris]
MLAALSIRDIVLIERLEIDFSRGLTVLTGETGAGKSILLDSLALALGGRGDAGLVRQGVAQGQVTAVFDVAADHPVRKLLADNDITDDGEIITRRIQAADGRTRAFLNDSPVSASLLRDVGELLVEIHGQHDDRALIDERAHRRLLDAFGGLEGAVTAVGAAWRAWRRAVEVRDGHLARIDAARREADYLRASLEELDRLAPAAGEEVELAASRHRMMQSEKVAGDLAEAVDTFDGSHSPISSIVGVMRGLERKASLVPGLPDAVLKPMGAALDLLEEARGALQVALRAADFDPRELERTEERLFALRAAARKHSCTVDALVPLRHGMAADLADLDHGEEKLAAFEAAAAAGEATYLKLARELSVARAAAAVGLEAAVAAELPALRLERARFIVAFEQPERQAGPEGLDRVEFHVQTNPGTRAGPMMKVASGGELSRFLLALKVSLADRGSAPTLIFDEIDTGVGGAVAGAIGQRLARLAERVQVMSVTHAPQVAARADTHFLISKEPVTDGDGTPIGDRVATRVVRMERAARREEIARMLSGEEITAEARAAAERLMAGG